MSTFRVIYQQAIVQGSYNIGVIRAASTDIPLQGHCRPSVWKRFYSAFPMAY